MVAAGGLFGIIDIGWGLIQWVDLFKWEGWLRMYSMKHFILLLVYDLPHE